MKGKEMSVKSLTNEELNAMEVVNKMLGDGYELIYLTHFGSVLYGTNSVSSDTDVKGLFIPPLKDLILGRAKNSYNFSSGKDGKNSHEDIDVELWSISKFLNLLKSGDTGAFDLLYSMFSDKILLCNDEYIDILRQNHSKFISKNIKSFIGYCVGQASRYGIKGSRYGDILKVSDVLEKFEGNSVNEFFDFVKPHLEELKYCKYIVKDDKEYLSVLGKLHENTISLEELRNRISGQINSYGSRTKAASDGVDWKALSHAYRVIVQVEELLSSGFIKFPLSKSGEIKEIKYELYSLEYVLGLISDGIERTKVVIDNSNYPEDTEGLISDEIILEIYRRGMCITNL